MVMVTHPSLKAEPAKGKLFGTFGRNGAVAIMYGTGGVVNSSTCLHEVAFLTCSIEVRRTVRDENEHKRGLVKLFK